MSTSIHFVKKQKFKLTIELVPATIWFSSLYRLMSEKSWRKLKEEVYKKEGRKCWICGSTKGPFELHEFWEYDDKKHVQKLIGIHHLCRLCHMIKHFGLWEHTSKGKEKLRKMGLSREDLVRHFCKVNDCSKEDFLRHEKEAFELWRKRSLFDWKQDFGKYEKYITMK